MKRTRNRHQARKGRLGDIDGKVIEGKGRGRGDRKGWKLIGKDRKGGYGSEREEEESDGQGDQPGATGTRDGRRKRSGRGSKYYRV